MSPFSARFRRGATYSTCGLLTASSISQSIDGSHGIAAACALLSGAVFFVPTLLKNASWFGPVTCFMDTGRREVWLTIDDGPEPRQTPYILDVLQKFEAKASFFVIGQKIASQASLTRRILAEGHTLENHTFSHPQNTFWFASPKRARTEMQNCSRAIEETVGVAPRFFRAPVGFANPFVHAAASDLGLQTLGWSATGHDGVPHAREAVIKKIESSLKPGAIILMHDSDLRTCEPGSRAITLERLMVKLNDAGYRCIVPQVSAMGAYSGPSLGKSV